ncbi:TPA: hypothetical protein HA244_02265 [Candidatus Micrarchaeota archaeon]|nr:hypothetical protein [Candidatus Micrarchaeota archaeon]
MKKGHKVGFEIGKEWLAEIMDPEYMGLHNMAQFIWGLRQQEAEIIPIEDEKRHYKQGKVIEKRVLSPLDRKLDKKYNKITFQRSVVHAINSLKNDVDVIVVGQNHAVHIAELLKRAGYEVELNVNRQFQKENQRLQEKASKDPVFNRRLNRLAEFINRKANSA